MMIEQDDFQVDAILCHKELGEVKQELDLAQDTIAVALNIAGYNNIGAMSQFDKAHALMNMAQELKALKPYAQDTFLLDYTRGK